MHDPNYVEEVSARIRALIDPNKLPNKGLSRLFSSYALLALSKGAEVSNEDVHDAWSIWATQYDPDNDSIVPYEELSADVQSEDTIFRDAIRKVSRDL